MKTAVPNDLRKHAFFRVVNPIVTQEQDERLRHIIREELSRTQSPSPQQPSLKIKESALRSPFPLALIGGFSDYLQKTSNMTLSSVAPKPTAAIGVARAPRNTLKAGASSYSQINGPAQPGPAAMSQPVLSPPPVRG
jgi:hypothetical protein